MSSETKTIGIIVLITIIVVIGGIVLAGRNSSTGALSDQVTVKQDLLTKPDEFRVTGKDATSTGGIQIVEFGDFECPSCAALHPALKQLLQVEGDKIDFVFRVVPIHQYSREAAAAALAARDQGQFLAMNDILFEKQDEWGAEGAGDPEHFFEEYAKDIGLDVTKFKADIANNAAAYNAFVDKDAADATAMNINATPTVIINGKQVVVGAVSYDQLYALVNASTSAATAQVSSGNSSTAGSGQATSSVSK